MLPAGARVLQAAHGPVAALTVDASILGVLVDAVGRLSWLVESALSEQPVTFPTSFFTVLGEDADGRGNITSEPEEDSGPERGLMALMLIGNGG